MGGNALKQYETKRLPASEYFALTSRFSWHFLTTFGFEPVLIQAYKNKQSFGDADFLIDSSRLPPNWIDHLKQWFVLDENQIVKNSNVVSIGYWNFQIDLIVTPHYEMESAYFYFSYNDFGNLIGRIGHKLGIKIGHKGISLVVRHKDSTDHILKEIWLTKNAMEALELLGLDVERYHEGFDELEDIFNYVASSKYFDPEIYSLEHRSATSRIRDKKRATYNLFLKWVAETKPEVNHSFGCKSELGGYSIRMPYYETEVLQRWPWVDAEVQALIASYELEQEFKKVYNGTIVADKTGFSGKTLGAFMARMKERLTPEVKQRWINSPSLALQNIASLYLEVGGETFSVEG